MATRAGNQSAVGGAMESGFARLTVARLMEKDVQYALPHTKADSIASMMVEGFGSVPIVNERDQLLGIVSEFDLLASIQQGHKWSEVAAADIMTRIPGSVTPATDLAKAIKAMQSTHRIRMPVVDEAGKLVGIIARRDIVRAYLNYLTGMGPPEKQRG